MNWFPIPQQQHRMRKHKTPSQLKRIQKRTEKFKSGETIKLANNRIQNSVESIPNHDQIRLDESSISSPAIYPLMQEDFRSMVLQMQVLSNLQKEELHLEAQNKGLSFPRICIDQGVICFENELDDQDIIPYNMHFVPLSLSVSINRSEGWKRTVTFNGTSSIFGEKPERVFASIVPLNLGGLANAQIKRIVRDFSTKKLGKKSRMDVDSDELARKASEMKLTTVPSTEMTFLNRGSINHEKILSIETAVNLDIPPSKNMQFHFSETPSSERHNEYTMDISSSGSQDDDTMDMSEFPKILGHQPKP